LYDLIHFILPTYERNAFVQAIIIIFSLIKTAQNPFLDVSNDH